MRHRQLKCNAGERERWHCNCNTFGSDRRHLSKYIFTFCNKLPAAIFFEIAISAPANGGASPRTKLFPFPLLKATFDTFLMNKTIHQIQYILYIAGIA